MNIIVLKVEKLQYLGYTKTVLLLQKVNVMCRIIKTGCYNGKLCYGGLITCVQGDISLDGMDKILDLMDYYCAIQELLASAKERTKDGFEE